MRRLFALLGVATLAIGVAFAVADDRDGATGFLVTAATWSPVLVLLVAAAWGWEALRPTAKVAVVLAIVGSLALLLTTRVIEGRTVDSVWPWSLVLAGLLVVGICTGGPVTVVTDPLSSSVTYRTILGRRRILVTSEELKVVEILSVFGHVEVDLSRAYHAPRGAALELVLWASNVRVILPENVPGQIGEYSPIVSRVHGAPTQVKAPLSIHPTLRFSELAFKTVNAARRRQTKGERKAVESERVVTHP